MAVGGAVAVAVAVAVEVRHVVVADMLKTRENKLVRCNT